MATPQCCWTHRRQGTEPLSQVGPPFADRHSAGQSRTGDARCQILFQPWVNIVRGCIIPELSTSCLPWCIYHVVYCTNGLWSHGRTRIEFQGLFPPSGHPPIRRSLKRIKCDNQPFRDSRSTTPILKVGLLIASPLVARRAQRL